MKREPIFHALQFVGRLSLNFWRRHKLLCVPAVVLLTAKPLDKAGFLICAFVTDHGTKKEQIPAGVNLVKEA